MQVPLEDEVCGILSSLRVTPLPGPINEADLMTSCSALRERLSGAAIGEPRPTLSHGTFWEIPPRYRFDVLAYDIPHIGINSLSRLALPPFTYHT